LSKGRMTRRSLVFISQPSTICSLAGVPSASNLGPNKFSRLGTGSALPVYGRFDTKTASGTACGWVAQFLLVSKKTRIKSSMKLSILPVTVVGMDTARLRPFVKGRSPSKSFGMGVLGCPGL
jgi:hypothetical protein